MGRNTFWIEKKGLVEKSANFIVYLETRKIIHKKNKWNRRISKIKFETSQGT